MTTMYLIRHAEAEGNLYRIAQGQDNSNLTDRGWRQVRALERRFADVPIDAVYASDLYRTCATASSIYRPKGLTLHRRSDLREICVGAWEHRTWGDIYRRWPEEMEHFTVRPDLWHLEGAEPPLEARGRMLAAIRSIAAENDGKTVAIFTHGYVLRMVLSYLQGIELAELAQTPTGDNTAVSLLEAEGETLRVVYRDDASHLKTPEYLAGGPAHRRANGLEAGLWFAPPELPRQASLLESLTGDETAADTGETLVAYWHEEPVGLVQLGRETGHLARLTLREDWRGRGLGVQLLGQAVMRTRALGGEQLYAAQPEDPHTARFLVYHGFTPAGQTADGQTLLVKNIGFDPEILDL